jgi:hypothetical protein
VLYNRPVRTWLLASLLFLLAVPVFAQDAPPDGASDEAIALGEKALEEYGHGRHAAAYALFARAERLAHTPVFVLYMARCQRGLGRLLDARALYRRTAAEAVPEGAPAPLSEAVADAQRELAELEATIPSLRVRVDGTAADLTVTIDGARAALGEAVALDPGAHVVTVRRAGEVMEERKVTLAAGDGVVEAVFVAGAPVPRPLDPEGDDEGGVDGTVAAGAAILALGGASAIAGIVTGVLALDAASEVKDQCDETDCSRADDDLHDESLRLAHASTALFAIAGAAAITGTILLIVGLDDDDAPATPEVGLGYAGLRVRF